MISFSVRVLHEPAPSLFSASPLLRYVRPCEDARTGIYRGRTGRNARLYRQKTWTDGFKGDISYKDFLAEGKFAIEQGTWQKTSALSIQSLHKIIAYTHAMVKMIDDCVGRVFSALDAELVHDTIVIFTSDHGELLGDHGLIRKGPCPTANSANSIGNEWP